ncbi:MAG: phosphatase PAP2 family protein [Oscillospiraceae bacterium]|nr:phosphatase PAP2 family protein [Oscillospiraceae bacterium]
MFDKLRKWLPSGITMLIFPVIHMIIYETTNHFPLFGRYNEVYCRLDEVLPLVKWFMIPYCLWFVFIAGTVLLFFLTDMTELKRYVKYLMITVISVYPVFLFYPSTMPLRPDSVEGSGLLVFALNLLFSIDDPTNIFPSLHVIWAVGSMIALGRTKYFSSKAGRLLLFFITFMISVSTFMIKQHSVIDVIGALPFCLLGWYFSYSRGTA